MRSTTDSLSSPSELLGFAATGQKADDFVTLRGNPLFDAKVFLPPNSKIATREEAIMAFLARWVVQGINRMPGTNFFFRRPYAGFHPQIYAYENRSRYNITNVNPLAHFIRGGSPDGPWRQNVISPVDAIPNRLAELRVAIHGHFFYPELATEFFRRLACNRARSDIWLTTDEPSKAALLRKAAAVYERGVVTVSIVPNRGRDIGAFLTTVAGVIEDGYDVIGHIHGKRSLHTSVGEQWREFLWQNLVGGPHPMVDLILNRFAADGNLGLVFADDPHLPDWDANLEAASYLAARMGMSDPLPPFINFPVGTMFWARPLALAPLLKLKLSWDDYPQEPVQNDGTILNALERLLTLVGQHAGYRYATTHISGVTWNGAQGTHHDLECDRAITCLRPHHKSGPP